jgi:phage-related protein
MIGVFPQIPYGKRATSWIGYSEGSTLMIGGRCRRLARGFARPGFAFRVIYVATFADVVYVLHAFHKKMRQTATASPRCRR